MSAVLPSTDVLIRNHAHVNGAREGRPLIFVHGFACDQRMWHTIASGFAADHPVVVLDLVGAGRSDVTAYDVERHGNVDGDVEDLLEVLGALHLDDTVVVGHSFGATLGLLAQIAAPERIGSLALIGPSARYLDDPSAGYVGGFSSEDLDGLLETLEANFHSWANAMAPAIMGNPERPELARDLADTFCATDPEIAARWAGVSFRSDIRAQAAPVTAPAVVLQTYDDPIVPLAAGRWLAEHLPRGEFVQLEATGHCPHLSAPDTREAIRHFLARHAR